MKHKCIHLSFSLLCVIQMYRTCVGIFHVNREQRMEELKQQQGNAPDISELSTDTGAIADPVLNWVNTKWKALVGQLTHLYLTKQTWLHIEVAFFGPDSNDTGKCTAFGVTRDGAFKQERVFRKDSYHWIFIDLKDETSLNTMRAFCEREVRKNARFDVMGVRRAVCWPRPPLKNHYWCVTFAVKALQQGGILKYYRPETLDVDDVIAMLENHPCTMIGLSPNNVKKVKEDGYERNLLQMV